MNEIEGTESIKEGPQVRHNLKVSRNAKKTSVTGEEWARWGGERDEVKGVNQLIWGPCRPCNALSFSFLMIWDISE